MVALTTDTCTRCGMARADWKGGGGDGYWRKDRRGEGRAYCCSGCALNRCTCLQQQLARPPMGFRSGESA